MSCQDKYLLSRSHCLFIYLTLIGQVRLIFTDFFAVYGGFNRPKSVLISKIR